MQVDLGRHLQTGDEHGVTRADPVEHGVELGVVGDAVDEWCPVGIPDEDRTPLVGRGQIPLDELTQSPVHVPDPHVHGHGWQHGRTGPV